jgi:hypothetical protein
MYKFSNSSCLLWRDLTTVQLHLKFEQGRKLISCPCLCLYSNVAVASQFANSADHMPLRPLTTASGLIEWETMVFEKIAEIDAYAPITVSTERKRRQSSNATEVYVISITQTIINASCATATGVSAAEFSIATGLTADEQFTYAETCTDTGSNVVIKSEFLLNQLDITADEVNAIMVDVATAQLGGSSASITSTKKNIEEVATLFKLVSCSAKIAEDTAGAKKGKKRSRRKAGKGKDGGKVGKGKGQDSGASAAGKAGKGKGSDSGSSGGTGTITIVSPGICVPTITTGFSFGFIKADQSLLHGKKEKSTATPGLTFVALIGVAVGSLVYARKQRLQAWELVEETDESTPLTVA